MNKLTTTNVGISRREMLIGGACMAASLPAVTMAATAKQANVSASSKQSKGGHPMTTITTKDGTQIYYKDWGSGQPVVFNAVINKGNVKSITGCMHIFPALSGLITEPLGNLE